MLVCYSKVYFFEKYTFTAGVIKSMIGEVTNESNQADAFALLHVPWASGYGFGYVRTGICLAVVTHLGFPGRSLADGWQSLMTIFLPGLRLKCGFIIHISFHA